MTYNARIEVSADARKVEQAIDRIEQRLNRLRDRAAQISLGGISGSTLEQQKLLPPASQLTRFERTTKAIADSAKRASTALKGLAVAGGALAGADAINALGKSLEKASVSIDLFGVSASAPLPALNQLGANLREATAGIEPFVQALQSAGGSGLTTAAGIATATTAFIAFEPAITAALDKLKIAERAFKLLSPAIKNTEVNFDGYIKKIRRATDVVSDLRESQRIIRQELDNVNSSTEEAADTAGAYVRVTERLNDELRAQADLLRQVRGFTVENVATGEVRTLTELEATKGRQSIATRQRAAEFRARQAQEQEELALKIAGEEIALKKALEKLDNESITRANTRLDLQAQLTQELRRTVDAAKFRAGQPAQQRLLPAFTERGLKILDDSVRLNESQLRIETALNGQRARGVRFLEKQAQEERRQLDLGITGTRSNLLRPGAANLAEQQAQALAASRATERLAITQKLQQTTSGVRTQLNLQLAIATKLQPAIAAITAEFERQLSIQKQGALLAGRFNDIKGAENIPGSPKNLQARARRKKEAIGSGIIGGAFPLLFGQGIGAAVGGGAGGAAGGLVGGQFGFGLSLVGTALGSSFDALVEGAKELGAALDPLTADISAITKASGLSGTKLEKLILDLEKTGDAAGALSLATEELEKVVGQRGVEALKEFSQTTQDLSNDFEVFLTKFKAFMADVFNTLIVPRAEVELKKRGETIAAARESTDPTIQRAVSQLDSASTISERLRIQEEIVSLVEEEEAARRRELELQIASKGEAAAKLREVRASVAEKRIELEIEQLNADANDKTRVFLEKKLAFQRKLTQEQVLYNKYAREQIKIDILRLEIDKLRVDYEKQLARIDNAAAAANQKAARAAERKAKAPESKALSLQRDISRERLNLFNVDEQIERVGLDRLDILRREEEAILIRRDTEIKLLELARQDALNKNKVKADEALINELHDARISKVNKTAALAKEENSALIQRITLERELTKLAGERETEDIGIDLKRQVEAVNRRISNPFGGQDSEMLELRIQQVQRQEDAYRALDRQIADVNRRLEDAPDNVDLKQELGLLEGRKRKYAELLPILDQVQQEELRLQQTLQQLQPLTNALSQGLTDLFTGLIDGSKSAQEVFADMLKNMGQALIKQGAVMITQYIAIGIARAFALRQSPSIGTRASDFNLPGFGNLESTGGNVFTGFTPRANGGPVSTGTPYMVGERGPELFVPSNSGTIVPNNALGGDVNVVVNVTETQTDTRGNGARANQVGNALAAAVQAEIIKQKRPGGLLAN